MPKILYMGNTSSGVQVEWTPSRSRILISGWYDHYVGIEAHQMTLGEFFKKLNITEKDCRKAFSEK